MLKIKASNHHSTTRINKTGGFNLGQGFLGIGSGTVSGLYIREFAVNEFILLIFTVKALFPPCPS